MIRLLFTFALAAACTAAPVRLVDEAPVSITRVKPDVIFIDLGRLSLGNIQLAAKRIGVRRDVAEAVSGPASVVME